MNEELLALLADNPELAQLLELGSLEGEQGIIDGQMKRADGMRQTPMPEGRHPGRVFVASNPLEMVGAAGMRARGEREVDQATAASRDILGKQTAGRKAFAEMLAKALRGPQPLDPLAMTRSDEFEEG